MSATFNLFERWKTAKKYPSYRQAALALGVSAQTVQFWKDGRNGEPEYIEKMAHDLGEDPVKTILEAYAEQKTGASQRVLVKLSKRFAAVVLTLWLVQGATANPNVIKDLRKDYFAYTPHSVYYVRLLFSFIQDCFSKMQTLWTENNLTPRPA